MRLKNFASLAFVVLATQAATADDGWKDLFNGKNLDGWEQHSGKAKYFVADGILVGESVTNTGNSFLCPTQAFGDFELELDYQVDGALNSGVQFRSEIFPDARTLHVDGRDIKLPADRMHGYQFEIDMDPKRARWWSGGVYDEMRRNWLYPGPLGGTSNDFSAQGARISKQGEWNRLRILCVGPSIKTWLNGEPRADFNDAMTPSGRIGLQVHQVGNDGKNAGLHIRFRNIRIREINAEQNTLTAEERAAGWRLLWDGKTTDGWRSAKAETFPTNGWVIKDGVLTVLATDGKEAAGPGDIITCERFSEFELVADFKITPGANSGIKYFVQPNLDPITGTGAKAATGSAIGCEYQILDDARHPDAKMGRDGNRTLGSLYDLIPAAADKKPNPIGEWNTARIVVQGNHIEHWLNGAKVVEYDRSLHEFRDLVAQSKYKTIPGFGEWPDGHILLQEHGNEVSFRNIKIRVPAK